MQSLVEFEPAYSAPGEVVTRTTCFNSCAGYAHLVHPEAAVVERDYASFRRMQRTLFDVSRRPLPLFLRRGYVLHQYEWPGGASGVDALPRLAAQLVVDQLIMDVPGSVLKAESMAGVRRVRLVPADGGAAQQLVGGDEAIVVDAAQLRPPEYEVMMVLEMGRAAAAS